MQFLLLSMFDFLFNFFEEIIELSYYFESFYFFYP